MLYYPAYLTLKDRNVLVVGGGAVGCRRLSPLIEAGAKVTLVAPQLVDEATMLVEKHDLKWLCRSYSAELLAGQWLVIAATNSAKLNTAIAQQAEADGIFCNVANDANTGSFICPSLINDGQCQIAIATGGAAPVLTRLLKFRIRAILPRHLKQLIAVSAAKRADIKRTFSTVSHRRRFWEGFFSKALNPDNTDYAKLYQQHLSEATEQASAAVQLTCVLPDDLDDLSFGMVKKLHQADLVIVSEKDERRIETFIRQDCRRVRPEAYAQIAPEPYASVIAIVTN
ncbi:bifunctional precorrin-2 dehydrogenase/sirohydrochlorin ferrochelatase [Corallincola holothuriorum]|uniref:precorrin-2 dehydrogenase n=1 Tax=Corallincola holothuriorum TaxID=2282215 RepID=A0A368NU19_9GAMM|nr:bifunctional precorrin-2 dehydrogenase/sirohydrochlorin ferrochelatase [Corallincola holothuriorum]RCU52711.1 bifunctional precorrin-2 dehydrogenase/sirohydrochlorin ferrochelatase [Corallincola holothuriorum]